MKACQLKNMKFETGSKNIFMVEMTAISAENPNLYSLIHR